MFTRLFAVAAVVSVLMFSALGQGPADELTFVKNHLSDVVQVEPARLDDAAVMKVFAAPVYRVTVKIRDAEGATNTSEAIVAHVGDELLPITRPSSDADCPTFVKMLRRDFKLTKDADAATLQEALDQLYPIIMEDEKKAEAFHHSGNQWQFVRGTFFEDKMGFLVTTDASGTITSVKYVLKLPKA